MPDQPRILIVDDDPLVLESLKEYFSDQNYTIKTTAKLDEAVDILDQTQYEVLLADVKLQDGNGFDLLEHVNQHNLATSVIMFTGYGCIEDAVQAIKMGAFDYLTKPISDEEVNLCVERALQHQKLLEENNQLRRQLNMSFQLDNFVCQDKKMKQVLDMVNGIAGTDSTVLLTGESGTGKTMVARAIHNNSPRSDEPFVEVNCGALPDTLLESELFGHVKGAFSGAVSNKTGKFEAADKGTVFLDEISVASQQLQMKLLRVLESFKFEPVGSNKTREVDVRLILATNQNLKEQVNKGEFREDLYYRINVMDIHLPPLRERTDDILPLARHFIKKHSARATHAIQGISEEAARMLTSYHWPGNVRELENTIEKAVLLCKNERLEAEDLDMNISETEADLLPAEEDLSLKEALKQVERKIILRTLDECDGNKKQAAERLDINRTTLYNKLHEHEIMES